MRLPRSRLRWCRAYALLAVLALSAPLLAGCGDGDADSTAEQAATAQASGPAATVGAATPAQPSQAAGAAAQPGRAKAPIDPAVAACREHERARLAGAGTPAKSRDGGTPTVASPEQRLAELLQACKQVREPRGGAPEKVAQRKRPNTAAPSGTHRTEPAPPKPEPKTRG
jgi:hypothetical protein